MKLRPEKSLSNIDKGGVPLQTQILRLESAGLLIRSQNDVDTINRIKSKQDPGVFILRPSSDGQNFTIIYSDGERSKIGYSPTEGFYPIIEPGQVPFPTVYRFPDIYSLLKHMNLNPEKSLLNIDRKGITKSP